MGRPKGSGKKHHEDAPETVHGTETVAKADDAAVSQKKPNIAPWDTCRFHKTEGSRFFKEGEIIPDGWQDEPFKQEETK